jgi:hypothetical protein
MEIKDKEDLRNLFETLSKALDADLANDYKEQWHDKLSLENSELTRLVAELLYGFITLNEVMMRDRNQGSAPPNGFPVEKHLKVLSKITNPDRVNSQTVKQVEEAYFRIFGKKLVLGQSSHNGVPDDLRIVK